MTKDNEILVAVISCSQLSHHIYRLQNAYNCTDNNGGISWNINNFTSAHKHFQQHISPCLSLRTMRKTVNMTEELIHSKKKY